MNIIKIPFEAGALGKNNGCAKAPDAIVSSFSDICSERNRKQQLKVVEVKTDEGNFSATNEEIMKTLSLFDEAVILGGDHSITYSAFKASKCDALVILDAHPDAMEGTDVPSHEDFVRKLVDEKSVLPQNVFLFGLRSWHASEMKFLEEKKIKFFPMKNIFEFGIGSVTDALMENVRGFSKIYISVDIDVADPAFAPGTGYCEPGGLSSRELIYVIQRLKNLKNIRFFDLVEINPKLDQNRKTLKLGEKLIIEIF